MKKYPDDTEWGKLLNEVEDARNKPILWASYEAIDREVSALRIVADHLDAPEITSEAGLRSLHDFLDRAAKVSAIRVRTDLGPRPLGQPFSNPLDYVHLTFNDPHEEPDTADSRTAVEKTIDGAYRSLFTWMLQKQEEKRWDHHIRTTEELLVSTEARAQQYLDEIARLRKVIEDDAKFNEERAEKKFCGQIAILEAEVASLKAKKRRT